MTDYQGNSHTDKAAAKPEDAPSPVVVQKAVTGEVKVRKRSLGRKIKDLFVEADFKTVIVGVGMNVLIPAARNMVYDGAVTVIERVMYGQDSRGDMRRGYTPGSGFTSRISYQTPVARGIREVRAGMTGPTAPPLSLRPRGRHIYDEVILTTFSEAQTVLEMMNEILDKYDVVTIANLNELCGRPTVHTDNLYGWTNLVGSNIRQIREGYLLELPVPEAITQ